MTDLEPTFLRSAINEILPDLAEVSKDILEETLQSLGIETSDDFQFLEESDLITALRPIQAIKVLAAWKMKYQTPESSSASSCPSPATPPSLESMSPGSSSSASASSSRSPGADWVDTYQVPLVSRRTNSDTREGKTSEPSSET